eukprot:5051854-Amphidinium_carterae.2
MTQLHASVIRLSDAPNDYRCTWSELKSLNLLIGKQVCCNRGASIQGSIMGWDAALDTLIHSALTFMAVAHAAQNNESVRKTSWSVMTQIDDVLVRAAPVGENTPGSIPGSACQLSSSADVEDAISEVRKALELKYYPLLGAVMSDSKTVESVSGQVYLNLIITDGVMVAKGIATVWRLGSSELLGDTPLDIRIDAASGTVASAVAKGAPLIPACLCLRLFALYKTSLIMNVSGMQAWSLTNLPRMVGGLAVYLEGQVGWGEQHNSLAETESLCLFRMWLSAKMQGKIDGCVDWATKLCRASLCRLKRNEDDQLLSTGLLESSDYALPSSGKFVLHDIMSGQTNIQPSREWLDTYNPELQAERRLKRARALLSDDLSNVPLELVTDAINLEVDIDRQILESLASSKRVLKLLYGDREYSRVAGKLRSMACKAAKTTLDYLRSTPPSLPIGMNSILDTPFWCDQSTPCLVSIPWFSTNVVRPVRTQTNHPTIRTSLQSVVQTPMKGPGSLVSDILYSERKRRGQRTLHRPFRGVLSSQANAAMLLHEQVPALRPLMQSLLLEIRKSAVPMTAKNPTLKRWVAPSEQGLVNRCNLLSNIISSVRADTEAFWNAIAGLEEKPIDINRCVDQLKFSLAHRVYAGGAEKMISGLWTVMLPPAPKSESRIRPCDDPDASWQIESPIVRQLVLNADKIDCRVQAEEKVVCALLYGSHASRGLLSILRGEWSLSTMSRVCRGESLASDVELTDSEQISLVNALAGIPQNALEHAIILANPRLGWLSIQDHNVAMELTYSFDEPDCLQDEDGYEVLWYFANRAENDAAFDGKWRMRGMLSTVESTSLLATDIIHIGVQRLVNHYGIETGTDAAQQAKRLWISALQLLHLHD